jgi:hypothetical protein
MPDKPLPAEPHRSPKITILILFLIIQTAHSDHIVFEEIREMTGAISYIHIILPVDIPGLKERADQYYIQQV